MELIDTHAHIYLKDFADDREDMLARAADVGLHKIYMPNIDHTSIDDMLNLEAKHPQACIAMMGLHPCSVNKNFEKELYEVESWLARRKFAAVGEIGTDLYWDKTFWEQQQEAFKIQVTWAIQHKLPIVIHCRESLNETIDMVEHLKDENLKGVFHCFSGTPEQAKRIIDLGFYLGIGGVATFKNGGLDKVLPDVDLAHIVLETDSPYLAPVPHRGKRNEPAYLQLIAQRVADLMQISIEEVAAETSGNSKLLFS
ncbi:MAG TPA: TatD family hydrolase [Cyclobacteriaceae bacterium]|nr:TatD family hydrolase [Cyclobacteriaceae bacterium]